MANLRFVGYPKAEKGPDAPFKEEKGDNPALRGWPLVVISTIASSSASIQRYLFANAGFDKINEMKGLDAYNFRPSPTVTPVRNIDAPAQLEFGPELFECQPSELAGRYYSVADYHEMYKTRQLTPLDVIDALLPLIRRSHEPKGKYASAWVDSHEEQVRAAAKASTERFAAGKPLGIMDGVPFGVKDDVDVEGYISHKGMRLDPSIPFFQPAKETWWPAKQLEEAGGIMVGKNVMQELGSDACGNNPRWGTPVNWHNKSYYPGGSSAGAGSALGVGLVPICIGTDAGGSCRTPPALNGVYGLKPTFNRFMNMDSTVCDIGAMATNVTDLIVTYRLASRPNPDDPIQAAFAPSLPPSPSAKKYLGIYQEWFNAANPVVADACRKTIEYLTGKLGYEVVDIPIPYLREAQLAHSATCLFEGSISAQGRTERPADYLSITNHCNKTLLSVGSKTSAANFIKYGRLRELLMQHLAWLYKTYPGLLILTPAVPEPGWKKHAGDEAYGFSDGNMSVRMMMYLFLANNAGNPALVAPVGYVDPEVGEGKLPVSLMAMAEWGAEEQLFEWARDTETYLNDVYPGGRSKPKDWADVLGLARKSINS